MVTRVALAIPVGIALTAMLLFTLNRFIEAGQGHVAPEAVNTTLSVGGERAGIAGHRHDRLQRPTEPLPVPALAPPDFASDVASSPQISPVAPRIDVADLHDQLTFRIEF